MNEEALKALNEFLTHDVPDAYDRRGRLLDKYRIHDKKIGSGSSRVVIMQEFGGIKIAIKMAYNNHMRDNLKEWDVWQAMPESVRDITAKPYAISKCNRAIAFEYIPQTVRECFGDPIEKYIDVGKWERSRIRYPHIVDFNNRLKQLLKEAGYTSSQIRNLLRDNTPDNIGVRFDGSLVWIDFARGPY